VGSRTINFDGFKFQINSSRDYNSTNKTVTFHDPVTAGER